MATARPRHGRSHGPRHGSLHGVRHGSPRLFTAFYGSVRECTPRRVGSDAESPADEAAPLPPRRPRGQPHPSRQRWGTWKAPSSRCSPPPSPTLATALRTDSIVTSRAPANGSSDGRGWIPGWPADGSPDGPRMVPIMATTCRGICCPATSSRGSSRSGWRGRGARARSGASSTSWTVVKSAVESKL